MTTTKRFAFITAKNGSVMHIAFGKLLDGELLACGRRMHQGWQWVRAGKSDAPSKPVCKACRAKAP